jgi:hypothetical protein
VARLERALELAEHVPAQHVGQEDVERHGDRLVLQRKIERLAPRAVTSAFSPAACAASTRMPA